MGTSRSEPVRGSTQWYHRKAAQNTVHAPRMEHEVTVGSSSNLCASFLASVVAGNGGTNEGREAVSGRREAEDR
jgi:hypothetical protein